MGAQRKGLEQCGQILGYSSNSASLGKNMIGTKKELYFMSQIIGQTDFHKR